jgi:hypothetical protein
MLFTNYFSPNPYLSESENFMQGEDLMDHDTDENVFDPLIVSKPAFSENQIKAIADKISDRLVKIVETQLQPQR